MNDKDIRRPHFPGPPGAHEARLGDRGEASGRNIEQSRAIGQDDPAEGSRMGREADKKTGFPGSPDRETNAGRTEETDEGNDTA
ncbi:MAG: hypothetical protein WKG52_17345 [Variovorax sp.]